MQTLLLAVLVVSASAGWSDIYKFPWTNWSLPISTSVACPNTTTCFITGGTSSQLPQVFYTNDGFKTMIQANDEGQTLLLIDMAFSSNGINAVAGGVGALKLPGLQYSTDMGTTWQNTNDVALVEANRVYAQSGATFEYVGEINAVFNEEGVGVTSNGGEKWTHKDWSKSTISSVPAGCAPNGGAFMGSTWYIICGSEPQEQQSSEPEEEEQNPLKTKVLPHRRYELIYNEKTGESKIQRRVRGSHLTGNYTGAVLKTTDQGATYTVQYQESGKFEVMDICCANENNCIVTASGLAGFGAQQPGAFIMTTTDGKTWNLTGNYGPTINVYRCRYEPVTKTFWVAAGNIESELKAYVYTLVSSDNGKTWTQQGGELKGMIEILDFNFVGGSNGKMAYGLAGTIDNIIAPIVYNA